jgi:alpha-D-xyloside xylohydrolase
MMPEPFNLQSLHVEQPQWGRLPALHAVGPAKLIDNVLHLATNAGLLRASLHSFGLRLQLSEPAHDYGILLQNPTPLPARLSVAADQSLLEAGTFTLSIEHNPLAFNLQQGSAFIQGSPRDGHFIRRFRLPPFARLEAGYFVSLELLEGAPVYGLGEKWGKLDRRGQLICSYNQDALGVNAEWSYKNTPFCWSQDDLGKAWGLFVHTPCCVTHGVGYAPWSQRAYGLKVDDTALDLFIFAGKTGADILDHYTALTGRAPIPPLWSHGVILSKAYYRTADEILSAAKEVRARAMPCDVITLDGRAWQDTDTRFAFEWDSTRYPDPAVVINALKAMGFKICVWEYPLISTQNPLFDRLSAKGWLLKDSRTGEAYRFHFDPEPFGAVLTQLPVSGLLDFTHPEAYAFWRDQHKALFDLGIDMIKPDFGEQVEPFCLAHNGAQGAELHNVYALLYNRCVYEAAERYSKNGAFLFTRATWASGQRYPAQWGGDPQADWGGMAANLRGGISWGLSGAPYYATDVGGFYGDTRDPVLYVRWAQASVFSAHMRLHGIGAREPWSYGAAAESAVNTALKLRYRLTAYLRQAMAQAHETGLPIQRSMALAFPNERASWAFEDQWMCGADLLVAPCLNAQGTVSVYLPAGHWVRFLGTQSYVGGQVHHLTLALDEIAVFVRKGTQIPLSPAVENTMFLQQDALVAEVWQA